ncbi:MAG: hypothetical protein NZM43_06985 [Saprospiraceae bacterium]|nr:hypothetical protein [Saprospiraceae bacterium]MDW8484054.1 hypothetical protein [Saprospiraceae bacterium]
MLVAFGRIALLSKQLYSPAIARFISGASSTPPTAHQYPDKQHIIRKMGYQSE